MNEQNSNVFDIASARERRDLMAKHTPTAQATTILHNPLVKLPNGKYLQVTNDGKEAMLLDKDGNVSKMIARLPKIAYDLALANVMLERKILHLRAKHEPELIDWEHEPSFGVPLTMPLFNSELKKKLENLTEDLAKNMVLNKRPEIKFEVLTERQSVSISSTECPMIMVFDSVEQIAGSDLVCTVEQKTLVIGQQPRRWNIDYKDFFANEKARLDFMTTFFRKERLLDVARLIDQTTQRATHQTLAEQRRQSLSLS